MAWSHTGDQTWTAVIYEVQTRKSTLLCFFFPLSAFRRMFYLLICLVNYLIKSLMEIILTNAKQTFKERAHVKTSI